MKKNPYHTQHTRVIVSSLLFLLPLFSPPPPSPPPFPPPSLDCFYRMNNLHFALPDYQQALELDQSDWSIWCRIAIVFCELGVECFGRGQYSEAEEHFSSAIQHNPKVSRFYFCRARARHEREVREEELVSRVLSFYYTMSSSALVYCGACNVLLYTVVHVMYCCILLYTVVYCGIL